MKRNLSVCFIAMTVLAALAIPAELGAQQPQQEEEKPQHYAVTDLGTLGGTFSYAGAVNNKGWAVGAATLTGDTAQRAVVWRKGIKPEIGTFGGPNSAVFGKGLNTRGQVVGEAETSTPDPLGQDYCGFGTQLICLPFIWQDGVMTQLPTLGGYNGNTYDVNNRGQIAGSAQNTTLDPTCPFKFQQTPPVLWEKSTIEQLPTFADDTFGTAFEINDQGQVVGESGDCTNPFRRALLWQRDDQHSWTVTDLGNLGGTVDNAAFDINNQGQVVGEAALPGNTGTDAFLWQEGVMTDLGTVSGDVGSSASGINDKSQVVGVSCDVNANCRAFLWQNGTMTDLNTLIPPSSPLHLVTAYDINSQGQIVGQAQASNGELHAYLATPCEKVNKGCMDIGSASLDQTDAATPKRTVAKPEIPDFASPLLRLPGRGPGLWYQGFGRQPHTSAPMSRGESTEHTGAPLVDSLFCFPGHCRHYGYCEVRWVNGQSLTDGLCTSHTQFGGFCDIQPSSNCPNGKPPLKFSDTSCGGLGSDTIDLARTCSF